MNLRANKAMISLHMKGFTMKPTHVSPPPAHPNLHRILLGLALLCALLIALAIGFVDTAGAQPRPMGRGHGRGAHGLGMLPNFGLGILDAAEKLDLKADQVTRLKAIRKSAPGQLMPKAQTLMEARIDLQDLMAQENAPADALRQAHEQMLEARSALQAATFDLRMQIRDVLTPKQRGELKDMLRDRVRERRMRQRVPGRMGQAHPGVWGLDGDVSFEEDESL